MSKKVINLTERQKIKFCDKIVLCSKCVLNYEPSAPNCLKDLNIKKEIAFYKRYIAQLERIGNKEVEI